MLTNKEILSHNPELLTEFYENALLEMNEKKLEKSC